MKKNAIPSAPPNNMRGPCARASPRLSASAGPAQRFAQGRVRPWILGQGFDQGGTTCLGPHTRGRDADLERSLRIPDDLIEGRGGDGAPGGGPNEKVLYCHHNPEPEDGELEWLTIEVPTNSKGHDKHVDDCRLEVGVVGEECSCPG